MKTSTVARHGDLNFRRLLKLPKGIKKKKDNILALGEHTGHKHVIDRDTKETDLQLYIGDDGKIYMGIAGGTATIRHEEHKPITFEPGLYEMGFEREFDYFEEQINQVID